MDNVKINRIRPFNEWLAQRKLNEGGNPDRNVNAEHILNNVYGFVEYSNLLQEAYSTLQFDHYNSVIDKCLNDLERDAPGLKYHSVMELAKKKVKGDDGEDCIDSYLYKLAETYMKDEPVKVQDTELNDDSTNNDNVLRTARNLFIYHIVADIKRRFNYADVE